MLEFRNDVICMTYVGSESIYNFFNQIAMMLNIIFTETGFLLVLTMVAISTVNGGCEFYIYIILKPKRKCERVYTFLLRYIVCFLKKM